MMNAIIFARGKNIEQQVEICKSYAERKDYTVVGIMLGGCHDIERTIKSLQGEIRIDRVIIQDITRISRNALTNYTVQQTLEFDCGVLIETVE